MIAANPAIDASDFIVSSYPNIWAAEMSRLPSAQCASELAFFADGYRELCAEDIVVLGDIVVLLDEREVPAVGYTALRLLLVESTRIVRRRYGQMSVGLGVTLSLQTT